MSTAEDYEAAFHGVELPEGPVQLGPGASIPDVKLFISKEIYILKTGQSERVKEAVRYRLDKLIEIVNATQ